MVRCRKPRRGPIFRDRMMGLQVSNLTFLDMCTLRYWKLAISFKELPEMDSWPSGPTEKLFLARKKKKRKYGPPLLTQVLNKYLQIPPEQRQQWREKINVKQRFKHNITSISNKILNPQYYEHQGNLHKIKPMYFVICCNMRWKLEHRALRSKETIQHLNIPQIINRKSAMCITNITVWDPV
jgi:hypothetical protein